MRRIHDRRLVPVYDIGTLDDGRPYFVMDYINGGSMNDLRSQGIDPVRALQLCAEACRALDVLHLHEIIHRDVTPGNLLLSRTGNGHTQVLIADGVRVHGVVQPTLVLPSRCLTRLAPL